jgi:hypothetical protein
MIKFNPKSKAVLTYGEILDPATKITDKENAMQYLKDYIAYIQSFLNKNPRPDNVTAEEIAKENLAYGAGYYDHQTRIRIEKLFNCIHPIFGAAAKHTPTVKEAFNKGLELGRK